ncbi:hypothetical protein GCM10022243_57170 [Saccharothrix violaceirubra]|uniref:Uncharacterized protein n=1 Tax=Saccharothrix violaceirubra TaxID=413306 RepID=A0A7W7T5X6_9PSEU|nr:hypothetical protein [Saccharothrix violaceirubra]MBB4965850.1 hypothetical protein [Saccharothrix violaceirubra]
MTPLERRYRRLLRVLPADYRADREEEMVATLLDDRTDELDREHGWPGWGEFAATVALSVRVRFAAGTRIGGVARTVALVGLLGQVVLAAQSLTVASLVEGARPLPWFDIAAVVAFAALVTGRRTTARVAATLGAAVSLVPVVTALVRAEPGWLAVVFAVPSLITAVAMHVGHHREAPLPEPVRWWWAAATAVVLAVAATVPDPGAAWQFPAAWLLTLVAVAVVRPRVTLSPVPGSPTR